MKSDFDLYQTNKEQSRRASNIIKEKKVKLSNDFSVKTLTELNCMISKARKERQMMTKKMKLVHREWEKEEFRRKKEKLNKRHKDSYMSLMDIIQVQPWERDKKVMLKKTIKREIILNKRKHKLISDYIKFIEKVDKNLTSLREKTKHNFDEIVENFRRDEIHTREMRKRREELKDEEEILQRKVDFDRLKILEKLDQIGEANLDRKVSQQKEVDRRSKISTMMMK